ncbi:MAG: hypothetical protein Q9227_000898 [Pyrenula ochraceoflavens]
MPSTSSTVQDEASSTRPKSSSNGAKSPSGNAASKAKTHQASPDHAPNAEDGNRKKRRKVVHANQCLCRIHLQERPCTRCIKRNIGHLCHDEPREPSKRSRSDLEQPGGEEAVSPKQDLGAVPTMPGLVREAAESLPQRSTLPPPPGTDDIDGSLLTKGANTSVPNQNLDALRYHDPRLAPNRFQDMRNLQQSYMFNAPEVSSEFNALNDFLLDDGAMFNGDELQGLYNDPAIFGTMTSGYGGMNGQPLPSYPDSSENPKPTSLAQNAAQAPATSRAPDNLPPEKAREAYYMTAADPAGTDAPEKRMTKLLQAKHDAGLLKPFNYVGGYARLSKYMERNMRPQSRQKISWQLSKFRPRFRERMHRLTDMELIRVEMWFEQTLMAYDRVFASMAVPACCWRRTGEIFRGNKEMAELIHVPIEWFRDGKLAIHEIIVEDDLVSYWEKFGSIAFDDIAKYRELPPNEHHPDSMASAITPLMLSTTRNALGGNSAEDGVYVYGQECACTAQVGM